MGQLGRVRRIVSVFGGLMLSGAALAALGYIEGQPARTDVPRAVRVVGTSDPGLHVARKTGVTAQTATRQAVTAVPADPVTAGTAPPAVLMPDLVGKRFSVALRKAKKLGITVSARDEYGKRVPASFAPLYRVKSQCVTAGCAAPPGGKLALVVGDPVRYAMGY